MILYRMPLTRVYHRCRTGLVDTCDYALFPDFHRFHDAYNYFIVGNKDAGDNYSPVTMTPAIISDVVVTGDETVGKISICLYTFLTVARQL
jgi:hypothetical protein